jgi:hypothetical protein
VARPKERERRRRLELRDERVHGSGWAKSRVGRVSRAEPLLGQKADWAAANLEEKGKLIPLGSVNKGFRAERREEGN